MPADQLRDLKSRLFEAALIFAGALAFLLALAPEAPFNRELGVCELGAVRDVLAGNVILPRFEPGVWAHVPPMYWWMAALSARLFGMSELGMRLPALVAAALTCAVLYLWTAQVFSRRAGLIAAGALLWCHFFADAARQPRMDSMLALFVTAAVAALERGLAAGRPRPARSPEPGERTGRGGGAFFAVGGAMMAFGILSKGPLGLLLPGLGIGLFLFVRGRLRELFRPGLILAFLGALAVGIAWHAAAYRVGGETFLRWQVETGLLRRFIPTEFGGFGFCKHPFYYFVPQVLSGFLPWSAYLPALAALFARRWLPGSALPAAPQPQASAQLPEPLVFAGCWFTAIFAFFSASTGKCLIYILPAFPPLAAMVGILADEVAAGQPGERAVTGLFRAGNWAIAAGSVAVLAGVGVAMSGGVPTALSAGLHRSDREFLALLAAMARGRSPGLIIWLALWSAGIALTVAGLLRSRVRTQLAGVALISASGALFWFGTLTPARAEQISLKRFAARLDHLLPAGATVDYLGTVDCDLVFYSVHPVGHVDALGHKAPNQPFLLIRRDRFQSLSDTERARFEIVAESAPIDRHGPRLLLREKGTDATTSRAAAGEAVSGVAADGCSDCAAPN